jgi:putative endopeptidase
MRTLLVLVLVVACAGKPRVAPAPIADGSHAIVVESPAGKPVVHQALAQVGLDADVLDRTIDPCEDFYQYACGGWIQKTEIPADKPIAMRSFVDLEDKNLAYERALLEGLRDEPGDDPAARQLGAFYGSCMDEPAIERAGLSALRPTLALIDGVKDTRSLTAVVAALQASGVAVLFSLAPAQDPGNARRVIAALDQGGLGLPDRDDYLRGGDQARALRTAYLAYIEATLVAIGRRTAHKDAADVLGLETELARVSQDRQARRDPRGTYHKLDRAGVARALPRLDWDAFWPAVGLKDVRDITVGSPDFLAGLDALLAQGKPEVWRAYLAFHATAAAAPLLTPQLEDIQFKFVSTLTGQPELPPRWKRCVQRTERALGDLIGRAFVRDRFAGERKVQAEDQLRAIVVAMTANLDALPWLASADRARAKAKLTAMAFQVGYPERWKTYGFKVEPRAWAANALAARKAERARQLAKIGHAVDKDDWQLSVLQVASAYDRQLNRLVLPAGILQPPLYSPAAGVAVNLGGIGVLVGHELTHGLDDRGAQYDEWGNLAEGWQSDTAAQFAERTRCVIEQYSSFEVGDTKLDGANAVAENIADIGGVRLALAAYRQLRSAAPEAVVADGFTEDQQFFLGFGQAMCAKLRPETEKLLASVDVRSPPRWRVNGALMATPDFAKAFRCRAGAKMVPAKQCVAW